MGEESSANDGLISSIHPGLCFGGVLTTSALGLIRESLWDSARYTVMSFHSFPSEHFQRDPAP